MERLSFADFRPLLTGLLAADTRIWRHFTPRDGEARHGR